MAMARLGCFGRDEWVSRVTWSLSSTLQEDKQNTTLISTIFGHVGIYIQAPVSDHTGCVISQSGKLVQHFRKQHHFPYTTCHAFPDDA